MQKQGLSEGSLNTATEFDPISLNASFNPILTVVFPIPALVGLIDVTSISLDNFIFYSSIKPIGNFAISSHISSYIKLRSPNSFPAISPIGFN